MHAPLPVSEIAPDLCAIGPWGRTETVVYLVRSGDGWTLVDAGWAGDGPRIQAAVGTLIGTAKPVGILLTHDHPDHEGDALALAQQWDCPVWVSAQELPIALRDFHAMLATAMPLDRWLVLPIMRAMGTGRRTQLFARTTLEPVVKTLDPTGPLPCLPDWVCIPTPGHTAGHVSFFRPHDRVLISGDALATIRIDTIRNLLARQRGLSVPPWYTTWDTQAAEHSVATLAALQPDVVAGGHGRPLKGPATAEAVAAFAAQLTDQRDPTPLTTIQHRLPND